MSGHRRYPTQEPVASASVAAMQVYQDLIATLPTPTAQENYLMLSGQCWAKTYLSDGVVSRVFLYHTF